MRVGRVLGDLTRVCRWLRPFGVWQRVSMQRGVPCKEDRRVRLCQCNCDLAVRTNHREQVVS